MSEDIRTSALTAQELVDQARQAAWALLSEINTEFAENPVARQDVLGMAFYYATGIWPTFKSAPLGMTHVLKEHERREAFIEWCEAIRDRRAHKIREKFNYGQ